MQSNGWDKMGERVERGPWSALGIFLIIVVVLGLVGVPLGWFSQAGQVAQEEFGPKAALEKYSWFIDQANRIEKMDQDLKIFEGRVVSIDKQYEAYGADKSKWPPHIAMQYNQAAQQGRDDLAALASQRNNLVRDYNAASEKFNWSPFQTRPDKPKENFHVYVTE